MKCISCGTEGAYQGLNTIECSNEGCTHYKASVSAGGLLDEVVGSPFTVSSPGQYTAIALNLKVDIVKTEVKRTTRLITFMASGDPGAPDKKVEFYWWDTTHSLITLKKPCTLSSKAGFYVPGVDADGSTLYKTHWQCNLDGVPAAGPWAVEARIS